MRRLLPLLVPCALAACRPAQLPPVDAGTPDSGVARPVHAHSHNDYQHPRPLLDALDLRFDSVEADLWALDGGDIGVSHDGPPYKGTLQALYLQPLDARIQANGGSVYGDGQPFFLWLELKESSPALQDSIVAQLASYGWLTVFDDAGQTQGAVTVVLTGNGAKKTMTDRPAPRQYIRDGDYAPTDPPADTRWGYYAVNYWSYIAWAGDGEMPRDQKTQLQNLVDGAHAVGRRLRVYQSPDVPAYWRAAREVGLDFLNTDDLPGLRMTLDAP